MTTALWILTSLIAICIMWPHHTLVQGGKPYLTRAPLLGGDGIKRAPWPLSLSKKNVFLHWIRASDGPAVHNHPYHESKSYIFWGRYREQRKWSDCSVGFDGCNFLCPTPGHTVHRCMDFGPGDVNVISGSCFHTLELLTPWALTLFCTTTKHGRGWGFLVGDKFIPASSLDGNARDRVAELRRRTS